MQIRESLNTAGLEGSDRSQQLSLLAEMTTGAAGAITVFTMSGHRGEQPLRWTLGCPGGCT